MAVVREVLLPDIGDFEDVDVCEVLRKAGERIAREDALIVLESDKAIMEIPAPWAGLLKEMRVSVGDKVSRGQVIAVMEVEETDLAAGEDMRPPSEAPMEHRDAEPEPRDPWASAAAPSIDSPAVPTSPEQRAGPAPHASPLARRTARELGVDLSRVPGTGSKGRVLKENIQAYVKTMLGEEGQASAVRVGPAPTREPAPDFSAFGPIERVAVERIRRISAANLHRSWVTIPHVTQFDEADITELEAFRRSQPAGDEASHVKLTFLPFMLKAVAHALKEFPRFNASLDEADESLILKRYYHIGVAVDTANGLVVPVVRDVDRKGIGEIAVELNRLAEKARERRLGPAEMQGGSFTISSLGGIGGTCFTPIVNHPEVAVLGVSRMAWKPRYLDGAFVPRRMLPLSLSYDHRVIDGAEAVRFTTRLGELLSELRLLLL